jgi:hypothetical protein
MDGVDAEDEGAETPLVLSLASPPLILANILPASDIRAVPLTLSTCSDFVSLEVPLKGSEIRVQGLGSWV